jgi:hypothetical protein
VEHSWIIEKILAGLIVFAAVVFAVLRLGPGKKLWMVGDQHCYVVGKSDSAPISSFKQGKDIFSRH